MFLIALEGGATILQSLWAPTATTQSQSTAITVWVDKAVIVQSVERRRVHQLRLFWELNGVKMLLNSYVCAFKLRDG